MKCYITNLAVIHDYLFFADGLTARFAGGNVYSDGMLLEEGRYP